MARLGKRTKNAEALAVLETRWEGRGNYGVRQLFELISAVTTCNPHRHRYDMFSDASSFRTILGQIGKSKRFEAVYVGSHGEKSGLENGVNLGDIIDALRVSNEKGNIRGIYFGVCSLGQPENITELLSPGSGTNLEWVVGYEKDIEWLESAAADLLFWSGYLDSEAKPLARAAQGAKNMLKFMPNAMDKFGFGAFRWSRDRRRIESLSRNR